MNHCSRITMSASDEDASFASADEGDGPAAEAPPPPKEESPKKTKQQQKGKKGKGKEGKSPSAKSKEENKISPTKSKSIPKEADKVKESLSEEKNKKAEGSKIEESKLEPSKTKNKESSENASAETEDQASEKEKESIEKPQSQNIGRDSVDDTVTEKQPEKKSIKESDPKSENNDNAADKGKKGWGWGWGSSLITAASSSVQTFTNQVGDGFNTIMDSVEASLGVPEAAELRAQHEKEREERKQAKAAAAAGADASKPGENVKEPEPKEKENKQEEGEDQDQNKGDSDWFSGWGVAGLAKKVQEKGKTLATKGQSLMTEGFDAVENMAASGIDVLESIGKKTYNTLSEHDPALRKTRDFLSPKANKPNLSGMLREAKEQAERQAEEDKEDAEARKAHFGTLFDDYQGIAHLEALEMLSGQAETKLHKLLKSLAPEDLKRIKPQLLLIKEAFETEHDTEGESGDQDFQSLVQQQLTALALGTAAGKLTAVHSMVKQWIDDLDTQASGQGESLKSVHQRSLAGLAELTAKGVEQFHKTGELVLLRGGEEADAVERAHSLARLTGVLCHEVGNLSQKFASSLNAMAEKEENSEDVNAMVTNIYLEAGNASTYLQDAFQLLLPVVQQSALEVEISRP